MHISRYLWRASPLASLVAVVLGIAAGACSALLITSVSTVLTAGAHTRAAIPFFFLCVVVLITGCISQLMLMWLSVQLANTLRIRLCSKITAAPLIQLEQLGFHRLNTNLNDDVGSVVSGVSQLPVVYTQLAVASVCVIYLAWLSLSLTAMLLVFIVFAIGSYRILARKGEVYFEKLRKEWERLAYYLTSLLSGIKELKLDKERREFFFTDELEPATRELRKRAAIGWGIFSVADAWGRLLVFLLIGLLIFVVSPSMRLQQSILEKFVITILYMSGSIQGIMGCTPNLARSRVALKKLEDLGLSFRNEKIGHPNSPSTEWEAIEFRGVEHTYYRDDSLNGFMLGPLDLELRRGEVTFVIGGNGSGKTTFAKLLTGLYAPERGTVLLDGCTISEDCIEHYRQRFSAIFSDFYVFDHLGRGAERISERSIGGYLERLHLRKYVNVDQRRLSTMVSTGQKKRLALLNVLLQAHPICVFDEWAADQDNYFKHLFYDELIPELKAKGVTVIVITHDQQFHSRADRIIEFQDGQVISDYRRSGTEHVVGSRAGC
jgi:putative ATP-binding cassette transporter